MSTKITQKNMDNQNKEQNSPINKHLEEKKKLTFKFGLKKLEGGHKLNWNACSFSHACKNMKGGETPIWRRSGNNIVGVQTST
jgi:hypothetical protein